MTKADIPAKNIYIVRMKTSEIAKFVDGELRGDDVEITMIADILKANRDQIAFWEKPEDLPISNAGCVIISTKLPVDDLPSSSSFIISQHPKLSFALIAAKLIGKTKTKPNIHNSSVIGTGCEIEGSEIRQNVTIGNNCKIGKNSIIHSGVSIGNNVTVLEDTVIHSNCVIYDNTMIGSRCVLHAGAIIGADGFGYVRDNDGKYNKFPQIGNVVIENDVEIGANTCVDRGALGETRIGEGTKIDNLVQVGHNVDIGKHCVIASQTGISGSVVIEDGCVIGGQVGFGDHVRVQSGSVIGSQAGVLPGKIVRPGVWWGTPIQPLDEYKRQNAHVKGLERLKQDVKDIKKKLA